MKKITLVLCACAIAFAGLLVSCSNDAGDEQIIFRSNNSYDYAYTVSGSIVETVESAPVDKAVTLTTTTTTQSFDNGKAVLSWTDSDDQTNDYQNYNLSVSSVYGNKVVVVKNTGTSPLSNTPKDQHTDNANISGLTAGFYSLDGKYYLSTGSDYEALTDDQIKALTATITVTGDIAEDDSVTIVITRVQDNAPADPAVDKTTTVYTYKLTKAGTAE